MLENKSRNGIFSNSYFWRPEQLPDRGMTSSSSVTLDSFARVFKEWELGVQSMEYQKKKLSGTGRGIPASDLERFRKLEGKMDEAFRALPPFEQETFWSEQRSKKK